MNPKAPVGQIPSIGKVYARRLKKLNIETVEDLICHFPFRYDDFSQIEKIQNLKSGEKLTIQGVVWQIKNIRTRTGKFVTSAQIADESGVVDVIWFNQSYLTKTIKPGLPISLSGKIDTTGPRPKMVSPAYEIIRNPQVSTRNTPRVVTVDTFGKNNANTIHTGRLVSIYPETEGLSSKWIRTKIANLLPLYLKEIKDYLPESVKKSQKLTEIESALKKIHLPKNYSEVDEARKRLAFDEIFTTQILSQMRRKQWQEEQIAPMMRIDKTLIDEFIKSLPFTLTNAQKKAIDQLSKDMENKIPTNRLLEGDVGSGKTVVAAAACLVAANNNFDSLIAAPTEILALQHHKTLKDLLQKFNVDVGIWTASRKESGQVTCGTHALLISHKPKRQVGLVVVDEQHRFGVAQRAKLFLNVSEKLTPHLLTMTATPIPRTLALTLYGDLDLSVLDEMPKGRQKISTFVVPSKKRDDCYKFIENEVKFGKLAFIITPFVEPSESMVTVRAAKDEFEKLTKIFKDTKIKLGLLHGRLKSKDKENVIKQFKAGKIQILVATPVVEVGIDVPKATIIVIESSDRFGLAQLHQLRGRVGRGDQKSYCFLFTDSNSDQSTKRLKSMEKVHVGFELAEIDLKMRGSGEIFGLKQSGFVNFKIADITDHAMVSSAQSEAKNLLKSDPNLSKYPALKEKVASQQEEYSQPN